MSRILKEWSDGNGLPDTLVIDGHIHIGEWPHATTFQSVEEAVEQLVIFMDANGVDAACALSGSYMWYGADYRLGNDYLLAVCQKLPERLIPFMHVNPNDSRENILAELDRMHAAGVRAIKLLNSYQQKYPGDGPNLMAVYEYAQAKRMLVINHSWTDAELMNIAPKFPGVDFIFAHTSSSVLLEQPNVYDNIWGYDRYGRLDQLVAKYGAGKLMMGSDFMNPLSVGIGPVVHMPISDDDKRLILGLNIARLLDKVGILPKTLKEKYRLNEISK